MIFPGQAEVGVQVYTCVCVCVDGKKKTRQAEEIHGQYAVIPEHCSRFVIWLCLFDRLLGSVISVARPVAVYRLGDVCGTVEVRALRCQYVWMMAGSLKAPQGMRGVLAQEKKKERRRRREKKRHWRKNFPLTAHPQRTRDVLLNSSSGKISRLTA